MSLATLSGDSCSTGVDLGRLLGVCGVVGVWTLLASFLWVSLGFLHGGSSLSGVLALVLVLPGVATLAGDLKAARTLSLEPPDVRREVFKGTLNRDRAGLLVVEGLMGADSDCSSFSDILFDHSVTLQLSLVAHSGQEGGQCLL